VERGYTLDSAVRYCSCSSKCGGSTVAGILDLGLRGEKGGEGDLYSKTLDIGWGVSPLKSGDVKDENNNPRR
jgi:hypothetical protein